MHCVANGLPVKRFAPDALSAFEEHSWPGNVRELENLIQRLVITVRGEEIRAQNLPPRLVASSLAAQEAVLLPQEGTDFDAEIQRVERALLNGGASPDGGEQGCGGPAVATGWSADEIPLPQVFALRGQVIFSPIAVYFFNHSGGRLIFWGRGDFPGYLYKSST